MQESQPIWHSIGKHTGLAMLVAASLVACSGDNVLSEPDLRAEVPIDFGGHITEQEQHTTRAVALEDLGLQSFHVWATKIVYGESQSLIDGYTVRYVAHSAGTTETNTEGWEYVDQAHNQYIKYWDYMADEYRFWAYAGDNITKGNASEFIISGLKLSTVEPQSTSLFSKLNTTDKSGFNKTVVMEFMRPYSIVNVRFYTNDPLDDAQLVNISDIQFAPYGGQIYNEGSMTVTYPEVATGLEYVIHTTDKVRQCFEYEDLALDAMHGTSSNNAVEAKPKESSLTGQEPTAFYVLPMGNANPVFVLTASINEEIKTAAVPAAYMAWQPNTIYTYIFKVTDAGEKIELYDVQVDPWLYGGSKDEEFNNW